MCPANRFTVRIKPHVGHDDVVPYMSFTVQAHLHSAIVETIAAAATLLCEH